MTTPEPTTLTLHVRLAATRDEVWKLVGDFGALDQWNPMVPNCTLSDDRLSRVIAIPGMEVIEVLDQDAGDDWSHSYTIKQSPMPITDYYATLSIKPEGEGSVVTYTSSFLPKGVPAQVASAMLKGFFDKGFATLEEKFGPLA